MKDTQTDLSYEQAMDRLQTLLEKLQDETTPLKQAIQIYAEAAELISICYAALENARLEIEEIDLKLAQTAPAGGENA